ncbi:MAG: hypothetical protein GDA43_24000 [Hormoscilla sp. SP5CHS1]|nr:hypothetical protein [Hormoscilla sp. SP12CHS1]MBC6455865.1 hypothetical protein [Hormoscilla sp. SP5CHS1]MBC6472272.1 hypothetical protein [Hormoscilla sp. GM102CHS1]
MGDNPERTYDHTATTFITCPAMLTGARSPLIVVECLQQVAVTCGKLKKCLYFIALLEDDLEKS